MASNAYVRAMDELFDEVQIAPLSLRESPEYKAQIEKRIQGIFADFYPSFNPTSMESVFNKMHLMDVAGVIMRIMPRWR